MKKPERQTYFFTQLSGNAEDRISPAKPAYFAFYSPNTNIASEACIVKVVRLELWPEVQREDLQCFAADPYLENHTESWGTGIGLVRVSFCYNRVSA